MANAKIYYQEDCNLSLLEGKTIAVIGYGSQGHAHALNAKESGCNVIIGLYKGSKSWAKAEAQGFEVYTAAEAAKKASDYLETCIQEQNSAGGMVECMITGVPAGIGEPAFEKLNANLGKAILSIGAVKAFEIGDGIAVAQSDGLHNNDAYCADEAGHITKKTNHSGGITGGISDGCEILFRAAFKPTPSISATQESVTRTGENLDISIKGRHDPIIVPRAVVVVECMAALVILDAMLAGMTSRFDLVQKFFRELY